MPQITLNGEIRQFPSVQTVAGLLDALTLTGKRLAVECNGEIVPKGLHASTPLVDGDVLEIVVAVGGAELAGRRRVRCLGAQVCGLRMGAGVFVSG